VPKLPAGTFTNFTNAPASGALDILLLDTLNTPMSTQADVRNQMESYLKESRPGTRLAIFGLTTRLILLQGFTSNPDLLSDVLKAKMALPKSTGATTDQAEGDNPSAAGPALDTPENPAEAMGNDPDAAQLSVNIQQFEAESLSYLLPTRARYTLDALNQLARYLSGLPGRKNLIWFSGSFPINILPDGNLPNPFGAVALSEDEFRKTTELLSRSQVAVYPIGERGPLVSRLLSAGEHGALQAMAEATGGEAFASAASLKESVEKAIDAGSNYYTLAYSPANQTWKGEYRKIQVEIARSGLTLAYRRGYFADDPNETAHQASPQAPASGPAPPYDAMRAAMMLGGPVPTEITVTAAIELAAAEPEPGLAPGNIAAETTKGPYRRYALQLGIRTQDLVCPTTPQGVYQCKVDVSVIVYDADGDVLNSAGGALQADIPADQYSDMLRTGLGFHLEISVPVSGDSFLRIGFRDPATNKIGAMEFPMATVSNLPPPATPIPGKDHPEQH
jgi:VWFA-related protein